VGQNAICPTNNWPVCSLIIRKVSKIGATRCQLLRLKCTKFAFYWPQTLLGLSLQRSPDHLALFKGPTSKGSEVKGGGNVKGGGERCHGWREGFGPLRNFGVAPPMAICKWMEHC